MSYSFSVLKASFAFIILMLQEGFMILEGVGEPWVEVVPSSWFDGTNCVWPPNAKSLENFVKCGYQPNSSWTPTPAKLRKSFRKLSNEL